MRQKVWRVVSMWRDDRGMYRRFLFEGDIHQTLECVPMAGRRQLDLARLKISLAGWQALPRPARERLVEMSVEGDAEVEEFARAISTAAADAGVELKPMQGSGREEAAKWGAAGVPEHVQRAGAGMGVAIDAARWAALDEVERFVIAKLADPKRAPEKLRAALIEIGIVEGAAVAIEPATVVCR